MTHQIHPSTEIGLVKLKISDLRRSLIFYTEVVGLRILNQTEDKAELTVDGKYPLLILEQIANAVVLPERSVAGLYHFAILVPDRISLGLSLRNLIKCNIDVGQGDHLVSEALYIITTALRFMRIDQRIRGNVMRQASTSWQLIQLM